MSRAQHEAAHGDPTWLDSVVNHAFVPLISGRFITIFSFLFGLGFAVRLGRAERRGTSGIPLYVRRLVVMLGLGLAHLFLLFQGDIVSTYALHAPCPGARGGGERLRRQRTWMASAMTT